ncbi:hypothetical protein Bbelb_290600 [Branchiostoma belcheri]|nr:hypothetical protein Bbelb_290600 [Branchiostoma belcheri]
MRISFRGTFCEIPRYVLRNIAGRRAGDCGRTCVRLGDVPQNFAELSQNCPLVMGNATAKLLQQRKPEVNDLRQRVNKRGQTLVRRASHSVDFHHLCSQVDSSRVPVANAVMDTLLCDVCGSVFDSYAGLVCHAKVEHSKLWSNVIAGPTPFDMEYSRLLHNMARHRLVVRREVAPDGNCQFAAVADQLQRIGRGVLSPQDLRRMAVTYIRNNPVLVSNYLVSSLCKRKLCHPRMDVERAATPGPDKCKVSDFVDGENLEEYLHRMSQDGTWGDHLTLQALCSSLHIRVCIVSSSSGNLISVVPSGMASSAEVIHLGHISEEHYISLETEGQNAEGGAVWDDAGYSYSRPEDVDSSPVFMPQISSTRNRFAILSSEEEEDNKPNQSAQRQRRRKLKRSQQCPSAASEVPDVINISDDSEEEETIPTTKRRRVKKLFTTTSEEEDNKPSNQSAQRQRRRKLKRSQQCPSAASEISTGATSGFIYISDDNESQVQPKEEGDNDLDRMCQQSCHDDNKAIFHGRHTPVTNLEILDLLFSPKRITHKYMANQEGRDHNASFRKLVCSKINIKAKHSYFHQTLEPVLDENIQTLLNTPEVSNGWSNNNCESIYHVLSPQSLPKLIDIRWFLFNFGLSGVVVDNVVEKVVADGLCKTPAEVDSLLNSNDQKQSKTKLQSQISANWSSEETRCLISLWNNDRIKNKMETVRRKEATLKQVKKKLIDLKYAYRRHKDNNRNDDEDNVDASDAEIEVEAREPTPPLDTEDAMTGGPFFAIRVFYKWLSGNLEYLLNENPQQFEWDKEASATMNLGGPSRTTVAKKMRVTLPEAGSFMISSSHALARDEPTDVVPLIDNPTVQAELGGTKAFGYLRKLMDVYFSRETLRTTEARACMLPLMLTLWRQLFDTYSRGRLPLSLISFFTMWFTLNRPLNVTDAVWDMLPCSKVGADPVHQSPQMTLCEHCQSVNWPDDGDNRKDRQKDVYQRLTTWLECVEQAQEAELVTGWQLQPVLQFNVCPAGWKCYPVSNTCALTLTMPEHMTSLSQQEFDSATEEAIVGGTNSNSGLKPSLGYHRANYVNSSRNILDKKTLQDTAARHKRVCDITNSKTTSLKIHLLDDHVVSCIPALNPKCFALVRDVAEKYQGGGHINGQGKKREVREALFEHLKGRAAEDQEMWL